jgi:hypothetical protein
MREALAVARLSVEAHWSRRTDQGHEPDEEELTNMLLASAGDVVKYAQFNRQQEAKLGADWLWWFVDGATGGAFGILVQAKKLRGRAGQWTVDVGYRAGAQCRALLAAADDLNVPAGYVLYNGPLMRRLDLECPSHLGPLCDGCDRRSTSVIDALTVANWVAGQDQIPSHVVETIYASSVPIEELGSDSGHRVPLIPTVMASLHGTPLGEFVVRRQDGPGSVAKQILRSVARTRQGQFSLATIEVARTSGQPRFTDLPTDRGHLAQPYFPFVFRGLVREAPEYVTEFVEGASDPELPANVRGIAVFRM